MKSLILFLLCTTLGLGQNFRTEFRAAALADDFGKMRDLIEQVKAKRGDAAANEIFAIFVSSEGPYVQAKLAGPAGASKLAEEETYLTKLAQIDGTYGTRDKFLSQRYAWLTGLSEDHLKARLDSARKDDEAFPAYNAALSSRTEGKATEAIAPLLELRELARKATDFYTEIQSNQMLSQVYEYKPLNAQNPSDWFAAAYFARSAIDAINRAPFGRSVYDAWRLADMLPRAVERGKLRGDLIDPNLGLEEAREAYAQKLKELTEASVGGGGTPGSGGKAGESSAPVGPLPNAHSPETIGKWVNDTGFKIGKAKRNFQSHLATDNGPLASWNRNGLPRGQKIPAGFLPDPAELELDGSKLNLFLQGKERSKPIRLKLPSKPEVISFPMEWPDGMKGTLYYEATVYNEWKVNDYRFEVRDGQFLGWRGASVLTGKVRDVPIEIYDTSGNGQFDNYGLDTVVIGKGKDRLIQPLSTFLTIDGLLFEFKIDASGKEVRTRPYDGPVAALEVKYQAATMPTGLIASGVQEYQNYYFDLMAATKGPIWVIPGPTRVFTGAIVAGKGAKEGVIMIRGDRAEPHTIEVGKLNTWELGGAGSGFTAEFQSSIVDDKGKKKLFIAGDSIIIRGAGGETYERSTAGIWQPVVEVKREENGRPIMREEMKLASANETSLKGNNAYSPKSLEETISFSGDYFVRLSGSFAPLGKIDSGWRPGSQ